MTSPVTAEVAYALYAKLYALIAPIRERPHPPVSAWGTSQLIIYVSTMADRTSAGIFSQADADRAQLYLDACAELNRRLPVPP